MVICFHLLSGKNIAVFGSLHSRMTEMLSFFRCQPFFFDQLMTEYDCVEKFEQFVQRLAHLIMDLKSISPEKTFDVWLLEFYDLCFASQHNFLLSHCIINSLMESNEKFKKLLRLTQELDDYSQRKNIPDAKIISEMFNFSNEESDLVSSFINIKTNGTPTTGDIMKLYRAYHSDNPPSVIHLRSGRIMGKLTHSN